MTSTQGPWRQGKLPRENINQVYGVDREDGSSQLVAEVYGNTPEEVQSNLLAILAWCNWKHEA